MSEVSTAKTRWARVGWNFAHLLSNKANPYVLAGEDGLNPKRRTGWEDLFHSIKNLWAHTK
jgi:hypothetical protein